MKKLIKNKNLLFGIIGFVIGISITGAVAYSVYANTVTYDNTQSGLQSTEVQGAIDELYTKANTWINPNDMGTPQYYAFGQYKGWCSSTDTNCKSYADFPTTATTPPSGKNVYVVKYEDGQYGVCIQRNGKEHCFRGRNYKAEAKHVQEVFSDISCSVYSSYVDCTASDFRCRVYSSGDVRCNDNGTNGNCRVSTDGSVSCS